MKILSIVLAQFVCCWIYNFFPGDWTKKWNFYIETHYVINGWNGIIKVPALFSSCIRIYDVSNFGCLLVCNGSFVPNFFPAGPEETTQVYPRAGPAPSKLGWRGIAEFPYWSPANMHTLSLYCFSTLLLNQFQKL